MSAPLWLDSPEIQQLLHKLVDRLDTEVANGKESVRGFLLDQRSWPSLYGAGRETDKENLWSCIEWLAQQGWFNIEFSKLRSPQAAYERSPKLTSLNAELLRAATGRLQRLVSGKEQWRIAVQQHLDASDDVKKTISRYCIEIPGRSAEEVVGRLNNLVRLAAEPLLLREVSAQLFWGQSKILDTRERQELIANFLGLEECPFPLTPVQLQIFLPHSGFSGVLFIENQATFEQAIRSGDGRFSSLALVFAAGFKGSAKRLRTRSGSSLYFSELGDLSLVGTSFFANWLYQEKIMPSWFWGDLDYAGMQILQVLRSSFSDLTAWQEGYAPMHDALLNGGGHAPEQAGKELQKKIERTGCAYADTFLLPILGTSRRFADQEMVWN